MGKPVGKMAKLWKGVEAFVLVIAFLCGAVAFFLYTHYSRTMPNHPDPSAGRIYSHNMHGSYTYLTAEEKNTLNTLFWIAGIGFVLGVCIEKYRTRT